MLHIRSLFGWLSTAVVLCATPAIADESDIRWTRDTVSGCWVYNPFPQHNEQVQWTGDCPSGRANGRGVLRWYVNGQLIERDEGVMQDGRAKGQFVSTLSDGSRYEGERLNSMRHGHGTIVFRDGSRYEGEWRDDKFNGSGTFTWSSGTRYEGEWRDGRPNGWGKATYAWDGKVYEGNWIDGCFQQGNLRWALFASQDECRRLQN